MNDFTDYASGNRSQGHATAIGIIHGRITSLAFCHPKFKALAIPLAQDLARAYEAGETKTLFKVFESFRLPSRQDYLFKKGSTKARAWQSPHQFGLACDFAAFNTGEWSWAASHDWDFLRDAAHKHGLARPIKWDLGHIILPDWENWKIFIQA